MPVQALACNMSSTGQKNISDCRGLICTLHCKHASTCFWNWSIRPSKAGSCEQRTISAHDLSVSQLEAGLGKGFSRATPPVSRNRHSWSLTSPLNTGRNMSVSRSNPTQQEFITLFCFLMSPLQVPFEHRLKHVSQEVQS